VNVRYNRVIIESETVFCANKVLVILFGIAPARP
jgi:hypothetical protein